MAVAGTVATVGSLEVRVTMVSVPCAMLIVAVRLAAEPTTTVRDGGVRVIVTWVGEPMTSEYAWLPVQAALSVAVTVMGKVPATVGVPESRPAA